MGITSVKSIPRAITEIVVHHVKGSMTNITPDIVLLRWGTNHSFVLRI